MKHFCFCSICGSLFCLSTCKLSLLRSNFNGMCIGVDAIPCFFRKGAGWLVPRLTLHQLILTGASARDPPHYYAAAAAGERLGSCFRCTVGNGRVASNSSGLAVGV